jgi:uncharacterized protein (DUF433 family)
MDQNLIHDRGRGPEIAGTRITVFHLLPYFLDPSATEAYICRINNLTAEQVAAARAYVLNHADAVMAEHLEIEARIAAGNPPSVVEKAKKTHETFVRFRQWLDERDRADAGSKGGGASTVDAASVLPAFREWVAEREAHAGERT